MTKHEFEEKFERFREEMLNFLDDDGEVPTGGLVGDSPEAEKRRHTLGAELMHGLRSVDDRYAQCGVWVLPDGERATIAKIIGSPNVTTRISKIRERISQGRHQ